MGGAGIRVAVGVAMLAAATAAITTTGGTQIEAVGGDPMVDSWDFHGDGYSELVIGVPARDGIDDGEVLADSGGIDVVGVHGPNTYTRRIRQENQATNDVQEAGDRMGYVVASADFDGDGYADLALGMPDEDVESGGHDFVDAGAIEVYFGSATGLAAFGAGVDAPFLHRAKPQSYDRWGEALAAGDFNGDGYGDLAVGAPWVDIGQFRDAGMVEVLYGSPTGLGGGPPTRTFDSRDFPHSPPQPGVLLGQSFLGANLAAGDVDGDGRDDLVMRIARTTRSGSLIVAFGSKIGIAPQNRDPHWIEQGFDGVPGTADVGDEFGADIVVADTNGDGFGDVIVGAPGETVGGDAEAGAGYVIFGSSTGLATYANGWTGDRAQIWSQDSAGIGSSGAETGDGFGTSVAAGHFNDDPYADVAFGVPFESIGSTPSAGAVNVIYGSPSGPHPSAVVTEQLWSQDGDIQGGVEPGDRFGAPLTTGDYDDDGRDDLVVGSTSEDILAALPGGGSEQKYDHGSVHIIYGSAGGITTAGNYQFFPGHGSMDYAERADLYGSGLDGQPLPWLWTQFRSGVPTAPRSLGAKPIHRGFTMSWAPPIDLGGTPVTYDVEWQRQGGSGDSTTVSDTFIEVTDLTPGKYTIVVSAVGATGAESPPSSEYLLDVVEILQAVDPVRVLETRRGPDNTTFDGRFQGTGRVAARSTTQVDIVGRDGFGADTDAVMVNLTVVAPDGPGHAAVFPCGDDVPNAAMLTYAPGTVVPATALVGLGDGAVCVYSHAAADLVLDVTGVATAPGFPETFAPKRLYETRSGSQNFTFDGKQQATGRRPAGSITEVQIDGRLCPCDYDAVFVNVTAILPSAAGHATIYDCTGNVPTAANLTYGPGDVVANAAMAKVSKTGKICIYTVAEIDLVVDVSGAVRPLIEPATAGPWRLLETRAGASNTTFDGQHQGVGRIGAGQVYELLVRGRGSIPEDVSSVFINVTAITPAGPGHISLFPCEPGADVPNAANLNYVAGDVVSNAALARVGSTGRVCIFSFAETDLVVDLNGYVTDPS